ELAVEVRLVADRCVCGSEQERCLAGVEGAAADSPLGAVVSRRPALQLLRRRLRRQLVQGHLSGGALVDERDELPQVLAHEALARNPLAPLAVVRDERRDAAQSGAEEPVGEVVWPVLRRECLPAAEPRRPIPEG